MSTLGSGGRGGSADPVTEFCRRVEQVADEIETWPATEHASRAVIERFGAAGLISTRWSRADDVFGTALIQQLASRGLTSTAVVVSLHVESVISMLRRFARPELMETVAAALAGRQIGCIAASEPGGGSDLAGVATTARQLSDGRWRITGHKKFVTLATQADFAVALARLEGASVEDRLGAFVVPCDEYEVLKTHRLIAGSDLETSWIRVDATVPSDNLLGRPRLGLAIVNWGLTKERLAVAALVVGACRLALTLATTRAMERRQFDCRLFDHQVIRLRLAELQAQLDALSSELRTLATDARESRRIAGLKVTAARFGERCLSECMHIFGGDGYVDDATPLGRLWRDIRLARIGGGTDEMMLEIVASGLAPDLPTYDKHVLASSRPPDQLPD